MSNLTLVAPIKGWVSDLEEVPDPVFAERILGDGLAIDPTGATLHAPCDATVVSLAHHAVTLRAANGAEILIHVGLETVALHGHGFVTHVREGASVLTGEPLITFDMDFLAGHTKSLISPVVITNGDSFAIVRRSTDRETALGEFLMELRPRAEQPAAEPSEASREAVVRLAHGLHARPAAQLAAAAKRFAAEIELSVRTRSVNAKSIAALMTLGVRKGERVTIVARGTDAQNAVDALAGLIEHGIAETPDRAPLAAASPAGQASADLPPNTLRGVCAAPGLANGNAVQLRAAKFDIAEEGRGIDSETGALAAALASVRSRLERLSNSGNRQSREILGAHIELLGDPDLAHRTSSAIEQGKSAAFAWRQAIGAYAEAFRAVDDARMRERVGDLVDLERQVLAALNGEAGIESRTFAPDAILIADELMLSDLAGISAVAGFCSARGGPTSHVAILAAGMALPALVSASEAILQIATGTTLFLNADAGLLHVDPDTATLERARLAIAQRRTHADAALAQAREECRMADGTRIEILANLGAGADEVAALAAGAEGCGLLRTEFLFQCRAAPPSQDEQAAAYQAIAQALDGRPLKIRTFDIGGDKPVPYLAPPAEDNPALGLRGIRAALWRSDLLKSQLAAILLVSPLPRIMLPMIASLAEVRAVRALLNELGATSNVKLGIMIETPSSAVLAAQLAREADFFSIGTNDLTQYTLAMDRGHAQLAAQIDAFHPAVLALIAQAVAGAATQDRPVAVCGGLAGDPLAGAILIGLGVRELSMAPAAIAQTKELVRRLDLETCRAAAAEALLQDSAAGVRAIAAKYLPQARTP